MFASRYYLYRNPGKKNGLFEFYKITCGKTNSIGEKLKITRFLGMVIRSSIQRLHPILNTLQKYLYKDVLCGNLLAVHSPEENHLANI